MGDLAADEKALDQEAANLGNLKEDEKALKSNVKANQKALEK
jgi:hypothetical protein